MVIKEWSWNELNWTELGWAELNWTEVKISWGKQALNVFATILWLCWRRTRDLERITKPCWRINHNIYYLRFKLIVTLWHFTLFTNCTLTLVCDLYVNKNIVMWDLVRFVLVCILLICTFYNFYKYKTKDIYPQSFALACVKSVSVTINFKRR